MKLFFPAFYLKKLGIENDFLNFFYQNGSLL